MEDGFGEVNRGLYIVRGENVAVLGEIDPDREELIEQSLGNLKKLEFKEIEKRSENMARHKKKQEKIRSKKLMHNYGLLTEPYQENLY